MIRLILAVVGLFIIWVLFFSTFSKQSKTLLVSVALILSVLGLWYESGVGKPRQDIVRSDQVINCGVTAKHSYRTNFDISLCLENTADTGHIKHITLAIIAQHCSENSQGNNCTEVQTVVRSLSIDLLPKAMTTLSQNLNFNKVDEKQKNIQWSFDVQSVKANK